MEPRAWTRGEQSRDNVWVKVKHSKVVGAFVYTVS